MLEVTVWDVSHGSAAWIRFPNGRNMVVDLGADGSGNNAFSPLHTMKTIHGVQTVDYAAITHGHADHLDDIFRLHEHYYPTVLITPRHLTDDEVRSGNQAGDMKLVDRYLLVRQAYTARLAADIDATIPTNLGGASFQFFIPNLWSRQNLNNHSMVVVVSYQGMKIVIPGDNEAASWNELMENLRFRVAVQNATILIAPHHGREAGYCSDLLSLIAPRLVIISDGDACDTSATGRYSDKASGCFVGNGIGTTETRKCLTTRKDGHITVRFGLNNSVPTFWVNASRPMFPSPLLSSYRSILARR
jgi:beta-lactamase superfamily II metal-dependent hydrolase